MVTLVEVKIQAPKELNDVRVCLVELIKDIKAGKSATAVAAENLPLLMEAVGNFQQVPVEVKEELKKSVVLGGLTGGELIAELIAAPASGGVGDPVASEGEGPVL